MVDDYHAKSGFNALYRVVLSITPLSFHPVLYPTAVYRTLV